MVSTIFFYINTPGALKRGDGFVIILKKNKNLFLVGVDVASGSLAEDPDVYATLIRYSEYPGRCLERGEPQDPLRETLRRHE